MRHDSCPPVTLNNCQLPQKEDVNYLGIYLDHRLTWRKHIITKNKQLRLQYRQMYWLLGRRSPVTLESKLLIYKAILKPTWTYGIQLWGTASTSNIEILQRFQNVVLRAMVNAPWYVPNNVIENDLQVTSVRHEIKRFFVNYSKRLAAHPTELAQKLMEDAGTNTRRLKHHKQVDIAAKFM